MKGFRKLFICRDCEGVYADQPVTRCDCMGREIYDEFDIVPKGVVGAMSNEIDRLREIEYKYNELCE